MASSIFQFGELRPEYQIPVINERAARAAAGILFFLALICFMNAWLTGNFQPTRVFIVSFLIDFTIRIFVNPRFAPTLTASASVATNTTWWALLSAWFPRAAIRWCSFP